MNTSQFPLDPPLQEDWLRFERRSAPRRARPARIVPPAAVWINRPALHGRGHSRALIMLLAMLSLTIALWVSG